VRYGSTIALRDISFDVAPGEFIAILGPSGCGKSTLLRAIAGLEPVAAGSVRIGGVAMEGLAPKNRRVAFVFQSYALYPHMTCEANIAAPLVMSELSAFSRLPLLRYLSPRARRARASIAERVKAMADQLRITPFLERRPGALSGGQRQRVALGRALIRRPDLFLLDEPLANLDASLRNHTRSELRALQRRIGTTSLFVTHDQAEAMAIADRVVVMFEGRIRQIGTPDELYLSPADLDVARFLSQPHLNVIGADALRAAIGDRTRVSRVRIGGRLLDEIDGIVAFRPEHASIRPLLTPGPPGLRVMVDHAEHGGVDATLFVRLADTGTLFALRIASGEIGAWPPGAQGVLHFALSSAHVFDHPDPAAASSHERAVA
jgi:multiple sugar transport system ATP-binding protein